MVLLSYLSAFLASAGAEEFYGPFSSWRNLKTDYGAVGDGKTDDTAALQHALNDLVKHQNFCVVYVPAGHYRLTSTVKTVRHLHNDCNGITLVGESPDTTVLQWDGPSGGTVVQYDAWYSRISRLTIDGAGRAGVALAYGPTFSTYNETSDLVLRDAGIGLLLGDPAGMGQAENEVLRCHFLHCPVAGLKTSNFNCLDIWAWYCRFEDCGYAMFNGAGAFHAWQSLFLRSTIADVGSGNLDVFSFVNNTSIGSRCFIDFDNVQPGALPASICGNHIIDPTDDFPLRLGNGGPYLVMDNIFTTTSGPPRPSVKMSWLSQTLVGNTYATTNAVREAGRFQRLMEKVAKSGDSEVVAPVLPPTPINQHRKIIELRHRYLESDGQAIQRALDEATQFHGQRPVVHLPMGLYKIMTTLVIPAGSDLQLVGDAAVNSGTCLQWQGPPDGLLIKIVGPARATLKDLFLDAGRARALRLENADQVGGRIFTDRLDVDLINGPPRKTAVAIQVSGLVKTDVLFRCQEGAGNSRSFLSVTGPPAGLDSTATNQISIFTGATGASNGHYQVRDGGRLLVRSVYNEHCEVTAPEFSMANSGLFSMDASVFAYLTSGPAPMAAFQDLRGGFTVATSSFIAVGSNTCRLEVSGDCRAGRLLLLNDVFDEHQLGVTSADILVNQASPPAEAGIVRCVTNAGGPRGLGRLDDLWQRGISSSLPGPVSLAMPEEALLTQLAPFRQARVWLPRDGSPDATDVRIYSVLARGGTGPVVEFRAGE